MTNIKQLTLNDIYEGLEVNGNQLDTIYDKYIILRDAHLVKDKFNRGTFRGTIDVISDTPVKLTKPNSTLIHHNSIEKEEYFDYE